MNICVVTVCTMLGRVKKTFKFLRTKTHTFSLFFALAKKRKRLKKS